MENRTFAPVVVTHVLPHLDEIVRALLIYLFAVHSFDLDGSRTGTPVKLLTNSANGITSQKRELMERVKKWIFIGVFGGPNDEHDKDDPTLSAATLALEDMNEIQFRERFQEVMIDMGMPSDQINGSWKRLQDLLEYVRHMDNYAGARRFGWSWLTKQIGRMICTDLGRGGIVDTVLDEEQLRGILKWNLQVLMSIICTPHDATPGIDPEVEELWCRWVCDNPEIYWPGPGYYKSGQKMKLSSIIAEIEKESSRPGKRRPKKLLRRLGTLQKYLQGMANTGDYNRVDDWMVKRFLATNPSVRIPKATKYLTSMTLEELDVNLNGLKEGTKHRDVLLKAVKRMMDDREKEKETRVQNKNNGTIDDRDPRSPYSLHAVTRALLTREKVTGATTLAYGYLQSSLNAWWKFVQLEQIGDTEAREAEMLPIASVDGKVTGYINVVSSCNPTIASRCFARGAELVVNIHPFRGHVYIGANQHAIGLDTTDELLRDIAVMIRIVEYKKQEIDLPEDLSELRAKGMLKDGKWYLHVNGDGKAVNLMNGSIHHPHMEATEIPRVAYTTTPWIVARASYCTKEAAPRVIEMTIELVRDTNIAKLPLRLMKVQKELTEIVA